MSNILKIAFLNKYKYKFTFSSSLKDKENQNLKKRISTAKII